MENSDVLSRASRPIDREIAYGNLPDQVADVRDAASGSTLRPLVLMLHGGFWRPMYDRKHTGPMTDAIADAGYMVAAVEYRRVPGDPQLTLDDIRLALGTLPKQLTGHDGRVILIGHSAGGHLALWAANNRIQNIAGVVALAPVADLQLAAELNLGDGAVTAFLGGAPRDFQYADPVRLPTPTAPVVVIQGIDDETVPLEVARSFVSVHRSARWLAIEQAHHYSLIDPLSAAWPQVMAEIDRLRDQAGPA